jgi:hypothetical protein
VVAGPDAELDRLEAESASRLTAPVVVVAIVLVATLAALGVANRPAHRHAAPTPPRPRPTPLSLPMPLPPTSRPDHGSVFLEHLARCTHTDGLRYLTVAVGVTNLSDHALRLVSATSLGSPGLRLDDVRVGTHPCAAASAVIKRPGGTLLGPSHAVVVSLRFAVGPDCPSAAVVAARVTFVGNHGSLHADSSSLADLSGVRFGQCPG